MTDKKKLTREQILRVDDIKTEDVEVPEWGGVVTVRGLTARERDRYEADQVTMRDGKPVVDKDNLRAKLVVLCCIDEQGTRLFADDDADDVGRRNADAIDRIYAVAVRLSGMGLDAIERYRKNS